jgi:hypothetical protein
MRKHNKAIPILITTFITALFFFVLSPVFKSQAGTLGNTYLFLSRIQTGLTGGAGQEVEMILAFTPSQSFSSGTEVEIFFPMADNAKWCTIAGSLTVTGVTSGAPDVSGEHEITAALPGTLSASCSQGDGTTTVDTISITGVGALVNTATYGVKISNGSGTTPGTLGTSSVAGSRTVTVQVSDANNLDSKAFGVYLLTDDTVEITATVTAAPTVTCTLTPVTVSLGPLYPGGGLVEVLSSDQITTSSTNGGYYWAAYGKGNGTNAGLYNSLGSYLISSGTGTGTINISGGGSEGFGINLTPPLGATVTTDFQRVTPGVYGSLGAAPAGARLILYKASATTPGHSASVYYGARAGASAVSGDYIEYLTYVCGGYY